MTDLVPIFGMLTGIAITGLFFWSFVRVAQGPVGQALGKRILGRHARDSDLAQLVAELGERVELLTERLAEAEERLDFTERLLAQARSEPGEIGSPVRDLAPGTERSGGRGRDLPDGSPRPGGRND